MARLNLEMQATVTAMTPGDADQQAELAATVRRMRAQGADDETIEARIQHEVGKLMLRDGREPVE
jgi:DNA-binding FadR family transcriptional regulator